MTPTSDVARRAHQHLWLVSALALLTTAAAVTWACWPVQLSVPPPLVASAPPVLAATTRIEPGVWDVRLWQPFTDAPVVNAAPVLPLKLYSILKRNGTFIAALSAGDHAPLVYASTGDVVQGVTIRSVDATGVDLRSPAGDQRLELRP
jgi:hypothetical protein